MSTSPGGEPPHEGTPAGQQLVARVGLKLANLSLRFSPRPMALLVRRQFAASGAETAARLEKYAPDDIEVVSDEAYGEAGDERLDVYTPQPLARSEQCLPTVVWIHGGGWVGGSKEEMGPFYRLIANRGYTVVSVQYSLAPEARYPVPVRQVMAALDHVQGNAARLHVDPTRLLLAGDSAGAQIAAQVAALATNPAYAESVGIAPTITPAQLRGLALCCGAYDLALVPEQSAFGSFLVCVLWAYSGTRDFRHDPRFATMSVFANLTEAFPPAFVTAGNADPLVAHSKRLVEVLQAKGVEVRTMLYPDDHQPPLEHEYQFDFDLDDARAAFESMLEFFEQRVPPA
jgi:acetyl esterase/lipase